MAGGPFEDLSMEDDEEHLSLFLLLLLFFLYVFLSLLATVGQHLRIYFYRIRRDGLRFQDTSLFAFAVLLVAYILPQHDIFLYDVAQRLGNRGLVLLSPLLRKLLRSGGQALRYLVSSYFILVGKEELSGAEVLLRGFTLAMVVVIVLIFVVPLVLGVLHYLVPLVRTYNNAFYQQQPSASESDQSPTPQERREPAQTLPEDSTLMKDPPAQWICPFCKRINAMCDTVCELCEVPRLNDVTTTVEPHRESPRPESGRSPHRQLARSEPDVHRTNEGEERDSWRITHFNMNDFSVLCQLGSGVTCLVTLVRVNRANAESTPRRHRRRPANLRPLREDEEYPEDAISFADSTFKPQMPSSPVSLPVTEDMTNAGEDSTRLRRSSSIAVVLDELAPPETSGDHAGFDPIEREETTRVPVLNGATSHKQSGGLKRVAASVPSELYKQGDEWRQTNVKWINQEVSQSSADNHVTNNLGLSNSGVPYADINVASPARPVTHERRMPRSAGAAGEGRSPRNDGLRSGSVNVQRLPKLLAIKTIEKQKLEVMGMRENIEREIRILRRCESPFVCRMFNAFQDDLCVYLMLEPVGGGDLKGLLQQYAVLYEREAKFYVACLLLALEHLQQQSIVCLDVKPENLLLDQWGYLKLTDFGVARMFEGVENRGTWPYVGTLEYISPEVIWNQAIPSGCGCTSPDTWAAGILIYEMLVGETPFVGDDDRDTKRRIVAYCEEYRDQQESSGWLSFAFQRPAPNQQELDWKGGRLSEETKELVLNLLQVDPAKRLGYTGVSEILQDPWFMDDPDFAWEVIRSRDRNAAPLVPEQSSLSPPFRNSSAPEDITGNTPMTFAEFQTACEKSNESDPGHFAYASGSERPSWTGIPHTTRPSVSLSPEHIQQARELCKIGERVEEGGAPMF